MSVFSLKAFEFAGLQTSFERMVDIRLQPRLSGSRFVLVATKLNFEILSSNNQIEINVGNHDINALNSAHLLILFHKYSYADSLHI